MKDYPDFALTVPLKDLNQGLPCSLDFNNYQHLDNIVELLMLAPAGFSFVRNCILKCLVFLQSFGNKADFPAYCIQGEVKKKNKQNNVETTEPHYAVMTTYNSKFYVLDLSVQIEIDSENLSGGQIFNHVEQKVQNIDDGPSETVTVTYNLQPTFGLQDLQDAVKDAMRGLVITHSFCGVTFNLNVANGRLTSSIKLADFERQVLQNDGPYNFQELHMLYAIFLYVEAQP